MRFRCPHHLSDEIPLYTSTDVWPMTAMSSAGIYQTLPDIIHTTWTKTVVFSLNTMLLGNILQCMYPHSTAWNQNTFWCSSLYSFLHRHNATIMITISYTTIICFCTIQRMCHTARKFYLNRCPDLCNIYTKLTVWNLYFLRAHNPSSIKEMQLFSAHSLQHSQISLLNHFILLTSAFQLVLTY